MNEFDNLEDFVINYDKVINGESHLSITRITAAKLTVNNYISVGSFFKNINDNDLNTLIKIGNQMINNQDTVYSEGDEIVLLTMMLSLGEGNPINNLEDLRSNVNMFNLFAAGTRLHRNNLVKANFDNMSFHPDSMYLPVFERVT